MLKSIILLLLSPKAKEVHFMKTNVSLQEGSWSLHETPGLEIKSMLYYVQSAGYFNCRSDYLTDRENYDTYLLALTLKGSGILEYRNRYYEMQSNDCFLIDCKEHQNYRTKAQSGWEFIWIHFNGSNIADYYHKIYRQSGPVYSLKEFDVIKKEILAVHELMKEKNINLQFIASKHLVSILTELVLLGGNQDREDGYRNDSTEKAIEYIKNRFDSQLSLDDIAGSVNLSKYHFLRIFKDNTGYTPCEYLKNYRISKAKTYLKQTTYSICEVSRTCGFESVSHFIQIFKQSEGVTPKTFRNYWR